MCHYANKIVISMIAVNADVADKAIAYRSSCTDCVHICDKLADCLYVVYTFWNA